MKSSLSNDETILPALAEVHTIVASLLVSALLFTYNTTSQLGCCFFASLSSSNEIISAIWQFALLSGNNTFLSGFNIAAVSAIKFTPQNIIISVSSTLLALIHNSKESPTKSAISCISFGW